MWAHKTEIRQERWHIKKDENYRRFNAFSIDIHLIVFLNTGKLVKFYCHIFCLFKILFGKRQYDPFHTIIDKYLPILKNCVISGSCLHEFWNVLRMRFSQMKLLCQSKNWRDDRDTHRDTQRVFFFFLGGGYGVENMLSSNILFCPSYPNLNTWHEWLPFGSELSRQFRNILREDVLVRTRPNNYCFHDFVNVY